MMLMLMMMLALCTTLAAAQSVPAYDVIIVGAGVAGIKSAFDLKAGKRNVLVLEARSRPYGRIDTQQPAGWPLPIELGAQWFHGDTRSNPVLTYAKSLRSPTIPIIVTGDTEDAATFNTATGEQVSDADTEAWDNWFTEFEEEFLPGQQEAAGADKRSLADAAAVFMSSKAISDPYQRRGFLSRIETNYVQEYAASASRLSLAYFNADTEILGNDSIASNYSSVFAPMVKALGPALRLGMVVGRVTHLRAADGTAVGVQVTALNRATQQNETFTASYLLSTLPLGVLKASYSSIFDGGVDPAAASQARRVAINTLGMGLLNKVIMQFRTAFWTLPDLAGTNQWMDTLPLEDASAVQWNEFFSLHKATKQNVLVAFQAGNSALAAEKLSDADTIASVMTALKKMLGTASLPAPLRYVITRWTQDPYALGAYSFVAVGATADARTNLCKAAGRLYFAGEACSKSYPATVQGAWLTGQSAAKSINSALQSGLGAK